VKYITVALMSEAKVLIEHLNLKRVNDKKFKIYYSDDIYLIISGIGSLNSSIATTYLLTKYKAKEDDEVLNLGICGSTFECKYGDIFSVRQVIDYESKVIFKLDGEKKLTTFNTPQNEKKVKNSLIDMEGFGFTKSARIFSKNVKILKVVSDFCDDEILSGEEVYKLMKNILKIL